MKAVPEAAQRFFDSIIQSMELQCSAAATSLIPLAGVAFGGAIGFFSARAISVRNAKATATAKFRASFAPSLAQIELHRLHGSSHDSPDVEQHFLSALPLHAAAFEEFRPFVRPADINSYERAWEQYFRSVKDQTVDAWDTAVTSSGEQPWHLVVKNINALLLYSKV